MKEGILSIYHFFHHHHYDDHDDGKSDVRRITSFFHSLLGCSTFVYLSIYIDRCSAAQKKTRRMKERGNSSSSIIILSIIIICGVASLFTSPLQSGVCFAPAHSGPAVLMSSKG